MNTISISLPEIIFSNDSSKEIIKKIGNKKCIVFTSKYWIKSSLLRNLKKKIKFIDIIQDIEPNPEIKKVLETCIDIENTDIIMCIGGGSVIDFAKAVIAFNCLNRNKKKFKENLLSNKSFDELVVPKILAIPTTSETGSERNSWETVWNKKEKYSVLGKHLTPSTAILDANLCKSMPLPLTISTGLDALSHAFEAIWNNNHNPLVDEIAKLAIEKIRTYLPLVMIKLNNIKYRREMQIAALLAGIAMSKTKTAICHSISYPLTSLFGLPHGIACSLTLSEVCKMNVEQYKDRAFVISSAMNCSNDDLEVCLIKFLKKLDYGIYLKPLKGVSIDESINFINAARLKNSLIQINNKEAAIIVNKSINKFMIS